MSERAEPEADGEGGADAADPAGADDRRAPEELPAEIREAVPEYDDEYLDRVSDRLMYSYDLDRDAVVDGERFEMTAEMRVRNQKQFLHPALSYADHDMREYVYVRRVSTPSVGELERLVEFAHDVADERVEGHEEHYGTDVTVVVVADRIPDDVADFVAGFSDRTLLKFGYYGHYEVNLVAVAPDREALVASENADTAAAFRLWERVDSPDEGFFSRFAKRFWR
ncbi:hypothetical protein PN419_08545 [Halorubrum ezzemoulense]|jgi:hypothetical protein|uniref:DUF8052 domain-containing protein n=2 Tax=Halorubrum ezzemoulense TaxID=337243 RepID=A0A256JXG6_HALEZ|nr:MULTISPECIES: hypothetical protein [Halorubrum]MDB2225357.1 hypothetical protein [Halorubrum ezzemoulense]MDB2238717.1 hypothetical protein [Halorubrum ezzemoulense]MDB2239766.1 hypothetical protein [Halorubrum ezzemoulense]MDB2244283.1 hypothetical protein [Halorubrum ezzemoulense]MDB2248025.1 hypothetical protein [Halorubrum ezzemoulense]